MKTAKSFFTILAFILFFPFFVNNLYAVETKTETVNKNHYIISEQEWSVPKNVQSILAIPGLQGVLNKLADNTKSTLLIRYPGGDVGVLWAAELNAWLVALGLSSKRINLQSGSVSSNQLELILIIQ